MRRNNISITESSLDQNLNTRLENLNNLQTQLFPGSYNRLGGAGDIARNVEQLRVARLQSLAPEQMIDVDASIIGSGESKLADLDIVQNVEHFALRAYQDPSLPLVDLISPLLDNLNVISFVPTVVLQVENTEGVEEFRQQLSRLSVPTSHSFSVDGLQRLHELASPFLTGFANIDPGALVTLYNSSTSSIEGSFVLETEIGLLNFFLLLPVSVLYYLINTFFTEFVCRGRRYTGDLVGNSVLLFFRYFRSYLFTFSSGVFLSRFSVSSFYTYIRDLLLHVIDRIRLNETIQSEIRPLNLSIGSGPFARHLINAALEPHRASMLSLEEDRLRAVARFDSGQNGQSIFNRSGSILIWFANSWNTVVSVLSSTRRWFVVSAGTLGLVVVVVTIAGSAVVLRISRFVDNAFSRILK